MSARGARSRKVQQKDIEKKEKKAGKAKATDFSSDQPHDPFADWRPSTSLANIRPNISRTRTVSSSNSHGTSRSRDSSTRPRLTSGTFNSNDSSRPPKSSGAGSSSISEASSKGKEKAKFQTHGKDTRAPRGRGGGVPVKTTTKPTAPSPGPPVFRDDSPASFIPADQKSWMNFKIWERSKDGLQPYGGFDYVSITTTIINLKH